MPDTREIAVTEMPRASVVEDGSVVELEFTDASGDKIRLTFNADDFERFSNRAIQLFTHARNQRLAIGDHLAIHPVAVVAAASDASIGGGKVLLSLQADNGVPYHFALEPGEAEALRPQLFRAAKSAKKQASQPRH